MTGCLISACDHGFLVVDYACDPPPCASLTSGQYQSYWPDVEDICDNVCSDGDPETWPGEPANFDACLDWCGDYHKENYGPGERRCA